MIAFALGFIFGVACCAGGAVYLAFQPPSKWWRA